jgi:hypothetical protein
VIRAALLATALAALLSSSALAATARPDAHDRALAHALDRKVQTFRDVAKQTGQSDSLQKSLDKCPLMKKDPSQAFAAVFALIPALLAELVNDFGPQLRDIHETVLSMHPHSPLFRQWAAVEAQDFGLILKFDNHGKKIDLCEAAKVMLDKHSTAADIHRVIGIDPTLIALIFQSPVTAKLQKLNPKMRPFFRAAGLSKADAKALTS